MRHVCGHLQPDHGLLVLRQLRQSCLQRLHLGIVAIRFDPDPCQLLRFILHLCGTGLAPLDAGLAPHCPLKDSPEGQRQSLGNGFGQVVRETLDVPFKERRFEAIEERPHIKAVT